MKRTSSIAIVLIPVLTACGRAAPPSPTPTATNTPMPTATYTPAPAATNVSAPTATKVWPGGTFPVETSNLIINYPDFLDSNEANKQA